MLAKSTVELVKSAVFENGDAFTKFPTYVIAISMAVSWPHGYTPSASMTENKISHSSMCVYVCCSLQITLMCQISFLNAGLARFDALKMVPTYQAFWIVSSM